MVRPTMAASASHKPAQPPFVRFWRDRRGNFATLAAVLIVPLVMLAGGATDYARSSTAKTEVQQALDQAVMQVIRLPASERQAKGVLAFRSVPLRLTQADDPVFTTDPVNGTVSAVTLARVPTAFLSMAGIPRLIVKVEASAGLDAPQVGRCLTILAGSTPTVASFNTAKVIGANCLLDLQSTGSPNFNSSTVSTSELCVRSTTVTNSGSTLTNLKTSCTSSAPAVTVPTAPTIGSCVVNNRTLNGGTLTLSPGTHCGSLTADGTAVTLSPGTHVIRQGSWTIRTGGSLTGVGVTIYFDDASALTLASLTSLNLSAPTSGAQQGVLFSEDLTNFSSSLNINTRPANSKLTGLIYLPKRTLNINTAGTHTDTLSVVAANANLNTVTSWTLQPPTTSGSGSGSGTGAPSYLTR
jgi:hypothetical protein